MARGALLPEEAHFSGRHRAAALQAETVAKAGPAMEASLTTEVAEHLPGNFRASEIFERKLQQTRRQQVFEPGRRAPIVPCGGP